MSGIEKASRFFVAGETGMVGSAIRRALEAQGFSGVLSAPHSALDLRRQADTEHFFRQERPEYVFMCAARVGGIQANRTRMADFAMENMQMTANTLACAHEFGVKKLLYMGSSCIYPRQSEQPIPEGALFGGPFEPTNEGYALAKSFGVRMCEYYRGQYGDDFIACIPANAYGPGDHFEGEGGHVVAALLERFHVASRTGEGSVTVWGSGTPRREFIYIDDLADAALFLMHGYSGPVLNAGTGEDASIRELAEFIREVTGYGGEILFDTSKPDGMPRRMLDSSGIHALGWRAKTGLREGLQKTYRWYLENVAEKRGIE